MYIFRTDTDIDTDTDTDIDYNIVSVPIASHLHLHVTMIGGDDDDRILFEAGSGGEGRKVPIMLVFQGVYRVYVGCFRGV